MCVCVCGFFCFVCCCHGALNASNVSVVEFWQTAKYINNSICKAQYSLVPRDYSIRACSRAHTHTHTHTYTQTKVRGGGEREREREGEGERDRQR